MYACPIGGTFFDELCLLMIVFDRGPMLRQGFAGQDFGERRYLKEFRKVEGAPLSPP